MHFAYTFADAASLSTERWMFHQEALQEYLLLCCQHPRGGLIDKPGKYVLRNIIIWYEITYLATLLNYTEHMWVSIFCQGLLCISDF